jgi:hypothetical protein
MARSRLLRLQAESPARRYLYTSQTCGGASAAGRAHASASSSSSADIFAASIMRCKKMRNATCLTTTVENNPGGIAEASPVLPVFADCAQMPACKHEKRVVMDRAERTSMRVQNSRYRPCSPAIVWLHSWNHKRAQNRDYTCEMLESRGTAILQHCSRK